MNLFLASVLVAFLLFMLIKSSVNAEDKRHAAAHLKDVKDAFHRSINEHSQTKQAEGRLLNGLRELYEASNARPQRAVCRFRCRHKYCGAIRFAEGILADYSPTEYTTPKKAGKK
jgi:hypothetical protein